MLVVSVSIPWDIWEVLSYLHFSAHPYPDKFINLTRSTKDYRCSRFLDYSPFTTWTTPMIRSRVPLAASAHWILTLPTDRSVHWVHFFSFKISANYISMEINEGWRKTLPSKDSRLAIPMTSRYISGNEIPVEKPFWRMGTLLKQWQGEKKW